MVDLSEQITASKSQAPALLDPSLHATWQGEREIDLRQSSFTFALIDDLPDSAEKFADKLASRCGLDKATLSTVLKGQIAIFRDDIRLAIGKAFAQSEEWRSKTKDGLKVVVLEQEKLLSGMSVPSPTEKRLSLYPVIAERKSLPLWDFARLFSLSGKTQFGFAPRFGTSITKQLQNLAENQNLNVSDLTIADDHVVTGSTIKKASALLKQLGINADKVVSLTQIGSSTGIQVDPVVRFSAEDEEPLTRMDLVDLIDFAIGFGGCWIHLPGGQIGQAPYCLPFANPTTRASIPESTKVTFSRDVLDANLRFFENLEFATGQKIEINDCDPAFSRYCKKVLGCKGQERITEIIKTCLGSITPNRSIEIKEQSNPFPILSEYEYPDRIIFVDVNNTLYAPGAPSLDPLLRNELKDLSKRAKQLGAAIGLCSDSPLPALKRLADDLLFDGPILAELGNVFAMNGSVKATLRPLEKILELKDQIREIARSKNVSEAPERWAVEFGGSKKTPSGSWFAFGAGREASISIFGDSEFIQSLSAVCDKLKDTANQDISIDITPNAGAYGVAIIHPVSEVINSKKEILCALSELGIDITMIGDSIFDLVPNRRNLRTILVSNSTLSPESTSDVKKMRLPYLAGAIAAIDYCLETKNLEEGEQDE